MIKEKIIIGENTKYPVNGLLTLPMDTTKPVPAVVFVHGSGSSNMDEKVGKLTPFKDLAEGLAKHGIASIRYDKRSFAHGFKMLKDKSRPITVKEETITVDKGFFNKEENDCYMYKVQDVTLKTSLWERIFGLGTVVCYTGDTTDKELVLEHVKNARAIKDFILEMSEKERRKRRTMNTLDIGVEADNDIDAD